MVETFFRFRRFNKKLFVEKIYREFTRKAKIVTNTEQKTGI